MAFENIPVSLDIYGKPVKVVNKPWGREEWLHLDDKYCYKRILIKAGTSTSFQYHERKQETNYLISGRAEFWLENDNGEIEKKEVGPGTSMTVMPPRKHRVIALTDIILMESSTPEVDDVVRIQDDYERQDGRIDSEHREQ